MKLHILKYIGQLLFLSGIIMMPGCSKFLEEKNPTSLTPDNFYTIPEHAEAAIAATYADTRFISGPANLISMNYQMLDAVTGIVTTESAQNSDLNNLLGLVYEGNNRHIINWWNGLYKVISQANLVLDRVPAITPMDGEQKTRILGEAMFLRAWAYFYAVRIWGDIPLILTPQTAASENFMPTRTSQEAVYEQIVKDLQGAEAAGLPWTDPSGRASTAAAKAQLAKVYLTMAGYPLSKGTEYYQLAANKANEVITNPGGIDLFDTYNEIHSLADENIKEHLFMIQYKADVVFSEDMQVLFLPNFRPITAYINPFGTSVPTIEFYNAFETGDKRTVNQEGWFYTSWYKDGYGEPFDLGAPYIFKHFNVVANGSPGVPGTARNELNIPQIRFAEVLLIFAEAQNELGGPDMASYNAYKRIRDRAELTTPALGTFTADTFREAVWRERWYEFCYENILWFDMLRLRKVFNDNTHGFDDFVGHINLSSNQKLTERNLLFPLPSQEMVNNPNLRPQNPGY